MKQRAALGPLGQAFATPEEIDVIRTEISTNGWNAAQHRFRSSRQGLMSLLARTNRSGTLSQFRMALRAETDPDAASIGELMIACGFARDTTREELQAELERLRALNAARMGGSK